MNENTTVAHALAWTDQTSRKTLETLQALLEIDDSWVNHGDRPIDPECLQDAVEFVQELLERDTQEPWNTYPTTGGGVELYWVRDDGSVAEIALGLELVSSRSFRMRFENEDGATLDLGWGCHYE
jgi:hypothetical protein